MSGRLEAVPITLRDARAFVQEHHRHSRPPRGWRFGLGAELDGELVAVLIAGRPVARGLDDGRTIELTRLCSKGGARNACSFLIGRARRIARELGYRRIVTYTLEAEGGASLRAAGLEVAGTVAARRQWDTPARRRERRPEQPARLRWEATL